MDKVEKLENRILWLEDFLKNLELRIVELGYRGIAEEIRMILK